MVQFEGGFHLQSGRRSNGQRSQRPASAPVPCRRALGLWSRPLIFLHLRPHPCACSSQSPLVGDSFSYSNPTQTSLPWTSLPHSLNRLSYSWDFLLSLLSVEGSGSLHGWLCTSWGQKPSLFTYAFVLVSKEGSQWTFAPVPEIIQLDDLRDPS